MFIYLFIINWINYALFALNYSAEFRSSWPFTVTRLIRSDTQFKATVAKERNSSNPHFQRFVIVLFQIDLCNIIFCFLFKLVFIIVFVVVLVADVVVLVWNHNIFLMNLATRRRNMTEVEGSAFKIFFDSFDTFCWCFIFCRRRCRLLALSVFMLGKMIDGSMLNVCRWCN